MRKLMKFAVFAGLVAFVVKKIAAQKAEWEGLSEAEMRAKLDARLPDKVPAEKRTEIADQVVAKMREAGKLRDEEPVVAAVESEPSEG